MKAFAVSAVAAALLVASPAAAAPVEVGSTLGKDALSIVTKLSALGYVVTEFEIEEEEIEVEATFEGRDVEIEISPETGKVTEIELED